MLPDTATSSRLDRLRVRFDPDVGAVPPHITLGFPARPHADVNDSDPAGLIRPAVAPFEISLGPPVGPDAFEGRLERQRLYLVGRYPNAANWVILPALTGVPELLEIRRVADALIPQPEQLLDFPPYATVGQSLPDDRVAAALAEARREIAGVTFRVDAVHVLEEAQAGWRVLRTVQLGG